MYKTKYWLSIYYLLHVSETYNTIMSLHALGISVDVHIRQLSVKKSCIIFLVEILLKKKEKNWYNCKNSEYLSVHGVMIYLFLLFPSYLFLQNKMLLFYNGLRLLTKESMLLTSATFLIEKRSYKKFHHISKFNLFPLSHIATLTTLAVKFSTTKHCKILT